jgi:phage shock protein PspC (stress-responsive transcriptional regulator)
MEKKLYRSRTEKMLCGVCGGLAKYMNMDVNIIRLITVLLTVFVGGGLIAYVICALILPEEPEMIVEEGPKVTGPVEEAQESAVEE